MREKEYKIEITGRVNKDGISSFRIDAKRKTHHIWEVGVTLKEVISRFDKEFSKCVNGGNSEQ